MLLTVFLNKKSTLRIYTFMDTRKLLSADLSDALAIMILKDSCH
jgi:hypothetical protein